MQILGIGVDHLTLDSQQLRFHRQRVIDPLICVFAQHEISGVEHPQQVVNTRLLSAISSGHDG